MEEAKRRSSSDPETQCLSPNSERALPSGEKDLPPAEVAPVPGRPAVRNSGGWDTRGTVASTPTPVAQPRTRASHTQNREGALPEELVRRIDQIFTTSNTSKQKTPP